MCDNCQAVKSNGYRCLLHAPGTPLDACIPAHARGITYSDWESRRWVVWRREYVIKTGKRWPTVAEVEARIKWR